MFKKVVVITTINNPTVAVKKFCTFKDIGIVVVGDAKTPCPWIYDSPNLTYLSIEKQEVFDFPLPLNSYSRKMIGYLKAIELGAEIIIDTDDDNIPYQNWSLPEKERPLFVSSSGFINIYKYFSNRLTWPRGLPFDYIDSEVRTIDAYTDAKIGIWQGLADNDPDVDAVHRFMDKTATIFDRHQSIVLDIGTVTPFNSQNTSFVKELFSLLYLPISVNQRFSDILRGYVAQPIMWAAGYLLGITNAGVYQERNEHDLVKDFLDEIPCYTKSETAFKLVNTVVRYDNSIAENMFAAYRSLRNADIVKDIELYYLKNWLEQQR